MEDISDHLLAEYSNEQCTQRRTTCTSIRCWCSKCFVLTVLASPQSSLLQPGLSENGNTHKLPSYYIRNYTHIYIYTHICIIYTQWKIIINHQSRFLTDTHNIRTCNCCRSQLVLPQQLCTLNIHGLSLVFLFAIFMSPNFQRVVTFLGFSRYIPWFCHSSRFHITHFVGSKLRV